MNTRKLKVLSLFIVAAICLSLAGCVAPNPQFDNTIAPSAANLPYVPDITKLEERAAAARAVNAATTPFNPFAPVTGTAVDAVAAFAIALSTYLAKKRNDKAIEAERQTAAAASMAQVLKATGSTATAAARDNAATPQVAATIAEHLQNS